MNKEYKMKIIVLFLSCLFLFALINNKNFLFNNNRDLNDNLHRISFDDIIPKDYIDLHLELNNQKIEFKNENVREEYLDYLDSHSLYAEFNGGMPGIGLPPAKMIVIGSKNEKYTFYENMESIVMLNIQSLNNNETISYGYFSKNEIPNDDLMYITDFSYNLFYEFSFPISDFDYLQILYYEDENYLITSELGDISFTYSYDNLINLFNFDPKKYNMTILENGIKYDELPSDVGYHIIVLELNEKCKYQLRYRVEE